MFIRSLSLLQASAFAVLLLAATPPGAQPTAKTPTASPTAEVTPTSQLSAGERIAQLRRLIDADKEQLLRSQEQLDKPDGEFAQAEAEFERIDLSYSAKQRQLSELRESGRADSVVELQAEVDALGRQRQLARERFDLAIEQRKNLRQSIEVIAKRIEQQSSDLARLIGDAPAIATPAPAAAAGPEAAISTPPPTGVPAPGPGPIPQPSATVAPAPSGTATSATPVAPADATALASTPAAPTPTPAPAKETKLQRDVRAADTALLEKEAAIQEVEGRIAEFSDRIAALRQNMEVERKLRATALAAEDNATKTLAEIQSESDVKAAAGASWSDMSALRERLREAERRRQAARKESRDHADRLDALAGELATLQTEMGAVMREADTLRDDAAALKAELESLSRLWNPRVLLDWFLRYGVRVIGIAIAMTILLWMARVGSRHIAAAVAQGTETGSEEERENRAVTLTSVFSTTARTLIWFGGIIMALQEVGIPIAPLVGGAAVGGLAVAFGAQNLIRDYFTGFVILLENQYAINDVVKVAGTSGLVERITLRMTVLRDTEGTVHFIPNGEIKTVSNLTHGWSRAVFDIGVAYKEDMDRVIDTIIDVGRELRADPFFKRSILEDLTMLGVDQFADSSVIIKFFIKTRPLKQWDVKRAMLRRLKRRFDEMGIEFPFPSRTIFHRSDGSVPFEAAPTLVHKAVRPEDLHPGQR